MKSVPFVSIFIAVVIVIVFSLYISATVKTLPCGKGIMHKLMSNFVHVEPYHLLANLFAIYALSRIEQQVGWEKFLLLVVTILLISTMIEVVVHSIFANLPCSIGFSGVLFGLLAWELISKRNIDVYLILSLAAVVIAPSLENPKASLIGHAVGAFSGLVAGMIISTAPQFAV